MSKVLITIGIPASGKTVWAIDDAKKTGAAILCRDDIRRSLGLKWNEGEDKVTSVYYAMLLGLIQSELNVICADTNINKRNRDMLTNWLEKHNTPWVCKYFPISLSEAISRDNKRGDARVGPAVIFRMQRDYISQFGKEMRCG